LVQRPADAIFETRDRRGRGPATQPQDVHRRAQVDLTGHGKDRFGQAQGAHGDQVPGLPVGQVEAFGGAKRVPVRKVRHNEQTAQAVPSALLAQPADMAQKRGHDAAEHRDDHSPAHHERNCECRDPVA